MKKKILVYSLGFAVCAATIGSFAVKNTEKESVTVITEEKKVPVRNAADTIDAGALSEEVSLTENIDDTEGVEKTTEYLSYYFDISLEEDGFIDGLKKICPLYEVKAATDEEIEETDAKETVEKEEEETLENAVEENNKTEEKVLSGEEMVKASIVAVGKEALAQTYSEEKIEERLEFYGIHQTNKKKSSIDSESESYIVCALDLGIIDEEIAQSAMDGELTEEEQAELLMAVANMCGEGRNYIGYSNDENIYADLRLLYELYPTFAEDELSTVAALALEDKNVQECVLKKADFEARFLPSLTICYSHESIEHMEQLIGLLNSENIVAKVQLEPKMIITKEDIKKAEKTKEESEESKENSEEKNVESIGTLRYDLVFEFETEEDMVRFGEVVEKYTKDTQAKASKENKKDEEETSEEEKQLLIADSDTEAVYMAEEAESMLSDKSTREIEKIAVENDNGKLEFYCLLENAEEVKEKVLELAKEQELSIAEIKQETEAATNAEAQKAETKANKNSVTKSEKVQQEKFAENDTLEETENEELTEFSLKLYSKTYICNKEFFFKLGGVDAEETEQETEETSTEQNTKSKE